VDAAKVKGFPIIVDDETRTLAGYIDSQRLHRAIGEMTSTRLIVVVVLTASKDQARQTRDLPPDTLCIFSPDPSEQPDARWSAVGDDEDMESNVLYAVAAPGVLKLWPWVNQVRDRPQRISFV
jgi:chloride channel 3/4/5